MKITYLHFEEGDNYVIYGMYGDAYALQMLQIGLYSIMSNICYHRPTVLVYCCHAQDGTKYMEGNFPPRVKKGAKYFTRKLRSDTFKV